ncbi:GYF domain-containing protein [Haloferula sargassicola]|uniref:GYF domain-containing protein n=1 Tax=Haloferula sargassicola TaxID=490096 RepID=A0ABP9URI8_9BACT
MSEQKDEWWVSRSGHQFGPVTFAEVVEAAKQGRLEPRTDMLYGGALTDWVPAGEVEGVFEKHAAPVEQPSSEAAGKSSEDKLSDSGEFDFRQGGAERINLPGATRLGWILGAFVLPAVLMVGLMMFLPTLGDLAGKKIAPFLPALILVPWMIVLVVTVKRFQNLGMSGWWLLGLLVPFLNWWLQYRLFACPPAYAFTKRLDTIGKVLATLYWLFLAGAIALGIFVGVTGGAAMFDQASKDGEWQKLKNQWSEMKDAAEKQTAPAAPADTE